MRIVSPRKSWSFSMVSGCMDTTELSSLTASSTISRFGDFLRSKIAVEKSFFPDFLKFKENSNIKLQRLTITERTTNWTGIVNKISDSKRSIIAWISWLTNRTIQLGETLFQLKIKADRESRHKNQDHELRRRSLIFIRDSTGFVWHEQD